MSFSDPAGYFLATRVQMRNRYLCRQCSIGRNHRVHDIPQRTAQRSPPALRCQRRVVADSQPDPSWDDDHGGIAAAGSDATAGSAVMIYRLRPEDYRLATRGTERSARHRPADCPVPAVRRRYQAE